MLTPVFSISAGAGSRSFWRSDAQTDQYVLCDPSRHARACGLFQSAYKNIDDQSVPSGRHSSNREQLRAAATEALELISGRDCAALDIGCNDGAFAFLLSALGGAFRR